MQINNENSICMPKLSVHPIFHVQNVQLIYSSVFLLSSKKYNTKDINFCEREVGTGRGSGTSGLRGAPSGYRVKEMD